VDHPFSGAAPGNNGAIDTKNPTPRSSRRFSDTLVRATIRAQRDPRRTGRVAGVCFGVLLFLATGFGYLFADVDRPSYLLLFLALVGAVLGAAVFAVAVGAVLSRAVSANPLPADADPAHVRAARRVLRTGEPSGRPEVDRIARVLAAQAESQTPRPVFFWGLGGIAGLWGLYFCAQGLRGFASGEWGAMDALHSVLGVLFLCGAVLAPIGVARQNRRTRALLAACPGNGGG
jgi:hypothetical protein